MHRRKAAVRARNRFIGAPPNGEIQNIIHEIDKKCNCMRKKPMAKARDHLLTSWLGVLLSLEKCDTIAQKTGGGK